MWAMGSECRSMILRGFFFKSKFYSERRFKEAFWVNLIEYRNRKRMEFASCLLGTYSVSRTAEMVGFG